MHVCIWGVALHVICIRVGSASGHRVCFHASNPSVCLCCLPRGSIPEILLLHECVMNLLLHVCLVYQQLLGTARLPACALVHRWDFAVGFAPGFGLACFAAQKRLIPQPPGQGSAKAVCLSFCQADNATTAVSGMGRTWLHHSLKE